MQKSLLSSSQNTALVALQIMLQRLKKQQHRLQQCRLHGLEPVIGQLSTTPEEQLDLASVSGGICLTPASTCLSVHPGQMVFRPFTDFIMELDFTLGWVREISNPAVEAMLGGLHAAIDRHQAAIDDGTAGWSRLLGHQVVRIGDTPQDVAPQDPAP